MLSTYYGCTCLKMRTVSALINGLKYSWTLLQFLSVFLYSWPKMFILCLLQNRINQIYSFQARVMSTCFSTLLLLPLALSKQYHYAENITVSWWWKKTLKVHNVFSHSLAKMFPTQSQRDIQKKWGWGEIIIYFLIGELSGCFYCYLKCL